jgi:hypothetical protein
MISQPHGEKRESVSCRFPHRKKRSIMNDGSKEMIAQIKYENKTNSHSAAHVCTTSHLRCHSNGVLTFTTKLYCPIFSFSKSTTNQVITETWIRKKNKKWHPEKVWTWRHSAAAAAELHPTTGNEHAPTRAKASAAAAAAVV